MTGALISQSSARATGLSERNGLSANYRTGAADSIERSLTGSDEMRPPGRMAIYRSIGAEVDLSRHESHLRDLGWTLYLPRTISESEMEYVEYADGAELVAGRFGIPEPVGNDPMPALRLDVILCPCVALDRSGTRVGSGAGYHDRLLGSMSGAAGIDRPYLVGIAFDAQVLAGIEKRDWDVPMDRIITESGVIAAN